ncbi:MAG: hypothetical protein WCF65_06150 [Parachlamydiaceae bacterium]
MSTDLIRSSSFSSLLFPYVDSPSVTAGKERNEKYRKYQETLKNLDSFSPLIELLRKDPTSLPEKKIKVIESSVRAAKEEVSKHLDVIPTADQLQAWSKECRVESQQLTLLTDSFRSLLTQSGMVKEKTDTQPLDAVAETRLFPPAGDVDSQIELITRAKKLLETVGGSSPYIVAEIKEQYAEMTGEDEPRSVSRGFGAGVMNMLETVLKTSQHAPVPDTHPKKSKGQIEALLELETVWSTLYLNTVELATQVKLTEILSPIADLLAEEQFQSIQCLTGLDELNQSLFNFASKKSSYTIKLKECRQDQLITDEKSALEMSKQEIDKTIASLKTHLEAQEKSVKNLKTGVVTALTTMDLLIVKLGTLSTGIQPQSASKDLKYGALIDLLKTVSNDLRRYWNTLCLDTYFERQRLDTYVNMWSMSHEINALHHDVLETHHYLRWDVRKKEGFRNDQYSLFMQKYDTNTSLASRSERVESAHQNFVQNSKTLLESLAGIERTRKLELGSKKCTLISNAGMVIPTEELALERADMMDAINTHCQTLIKQANDFKTQVETQKNNFSELQDAWRVEFGRINENLKLHPDDVPNFHLLYTWENYHNAKEYLSNFQEVLSKNGQGLVDAVKTVYDALATGAATLTGYMTGSNDGKVAHL